MKTALWTRERVGLGWGNPFKGGRFGVRVELGALLQGSPDVSLAVKGTSLPPAIQDQLAEDLALEEQDLEQDAEDFDIWPVISIALTIRI